MKPYLIILLLQFSFVALAQEGPKVVVFNSSANNEKPVVERYNMFKLSLLEPFSGDISFYYERILNQNVSVEVGFGFTMYDYLSLALVDDFSSTSSDRTSLIGSSFAAGIRYYPFLAGDEFYFAPEFKYRYYHSTFNTVPFGNEPVQTFEETRSMSNFRITVGYVYLFDDRIFIDYFAGIGIAMIKTSTYVPNYDDVSGLYTYNLEEKRTPRPRLTLGIKFGLNF